MAPRTPRKITGAASTWLRRFDRYTLDVFNPGQPYRPRVERG